MTFSRAKSLSGAPRACHSGANRTLMLPRSPALKRHVAIRALGEPNNIRLPTMAKYRKPEGKK